MDRSSRAIFSLVLGALALALLLVYYHFDPSEHFFPKCPSWWLTGYKCPGCGAQRAIHHLLHGQWTEAFRNNALLVVAWPYVLFGLLLEYSAWGRKQIALRRKWYGYHAARIALAVVILFCISRNVWGF